MGTRTGRDSYVWRQLGLAALAGNVTRPLPGYSTSVVSFFGGWLAGELAPQMLAVLAADNAVHVARHGVRTPADKIGLGLAAVAGVGLAASIAVSAKAGQAMRQALDESLGAEEMRRLDEELGPVTVAAPWPTLLNPFKMGKPGVVRQRNLTYGDGGRRSRLDIYRNEEARGGAPILLQVHGGGWTIGNKDQQGIPLMQEMAARGWVCASINYPLSPKARWPEHLIAVKQAIAWLREHAEEYGADPSFIAVTGGSAGGHLTAMAGLTANDPALQPGFEGSDTSVQALVPHYGVYDFTGDTGIKLTLQRVKSGLSAFVLGKNAKFPEDYRAASPIDQVHADVAPFLIIHGSFDSLVPVAEAREFAARLRAVSTSPVAYAEIPGAQHAFDVFPSVRSIQVVQQVARFLEWAVLKSGRELPSR
ncbi:alpha/beta hydrolase [Tomitella biformata]|uniref:alpha/beta hydrolase n=1 Tax=Tomitella biformata TaxID=630403 RepID=UPI000465835F|nr:alpha/beta hydrolase [Tomitella biformata]